MTSLHRITPPRLCQRQRHAGVVERKVHQVSRPALTTRRLAPVKPRVASSPEIVAIERRQVDGRVVVCEIYFVAEFRRRDVRIPKAVEHEVLDLPCGHAGGTQGPTGAVVPVPTEDVGIARLGDKVQVVYAGSSIRRKNRAC